MGREAEVALAQTALEAVLWGTSFPVVAVGLRGGLTAFAWVGAMAVVGSIILVSGLEISGKTLSVKSTYVFQMPKSSICGKTEDLVLPGHIAKV